MSRRVTPTNIKGLKDREVFVFGTNASGFHGAGGAGFAFRYEHRTNWRFDWFFTDAMNADFGSPRRVGKWAVFGVSKGLMQGRDGMSYGIQTVTRAGKKRSRPLWMIEQDINEFIEFAKTSASYTFYVSELGTGLAGYHIPEIAPLFRKAVELKNVYLPAKYLNFIENN